MEKTVGSSFQPLFTSVEGYLNQQECTLIREASVFATHAHKGVLRKSGDDYISHPQSVAELLASLKMDALTVTAALLHDVVEDTPYKHSEIEKLFGAEVASLVNGVSRVEATETISSKGDISAASFSKLFHAMKEDVRVVIIKLADRLHNMRTIRWMSTPSQKRIAQETLDVYAPIAHRLGMAGWCDELRDIALQTIYPSRHRVLREELSKKILAHDGMLQLMREELLAHLNEHKIQAEISFRIKQLYSVYQKMLSQNLKYKEIQDLFAFRIIVASNDQCYQTLGIVHQTYLPVERTFKDYIAIPKSNGYQSLHTIIIAHKTKQRKKELRAEMQIRTKDMHHFAENGVASHWIYKTAPNSTIRSFESAHLLLFRDWFVELNRVRGAAKSDSEFFSEMKKDHYYDKCVVYSPTGTIVNLPINSTVLDYAYHVSAQLGDSAVSGFVDQRHVPLSTVLETGQTIVIQTAKDAPVYPSYLNFVATQLAKQHIREKLERNKITSQHTGITYEYPDCCYPIRGDRIVCIATPNNQKINTLHRQNCAQVEQAISKGTPLTYPQWSSIDQKDFTVQITLKLKNKRYALAQATNVIAQSGYSIHKLHIDATEDNVELAHAVIQLTVANRDDLAKLISRLDKVTYLIRASRT